MLLFRSFIIEQTRGRCLTIFDIAEEKNAVNLVDRLEFSKANFSPDYIKGWQR